MISVSTNTALVVIDVQNGFINKNTCELPGKIKHLINKVDYRHRVFTRFINEDNSSFEKLLNWTGLKNTEDTDIVGELKEYATAIIDKHHYTCATKAFIDLVVSSKIDTFHIVGIDTDVCVLKSAVDIFERGFKPIIFSELCMSTAGEDIHASALKILARFIGRKQIIPNYQTFMKLGET